MVGDRFPSRRSQPSVSSSKLKPTATRAPFGHEQATAGVAIESVDRQRQALKAEGQLFEQVLDALDRVVQVVKRVAEVRVQCA